MYQHAVIPLPDPVKGRFLENHRAPAEKVPEEQLACGKGVLQQSKHEEGVKMGCVPFLGQPSKIA